MRAEGDGWCLWATVITVVCRVVSSRMCCAVYCVVLCRVGCRVRSVVDGKVWMGWIGLGCVWVDGMGMGM